MSLKTIKTKIRSVEKTKKVTKAMEAVSAAKMRKSQTRALSGRSYARAAVSILARLSGSNELRTSPLVKVHPESARALYIVITSDKGLAGALNSAVLRAALADIKDARLSPEQISIIAVGRKANDFFKARGFTVISFHQNTDAVSADLIRELVAEGAAKFNAEEVDIVKIAYQNFVSTFEQRPTVRTIFPLSLVELQKVVDDIVPAKGAFAESRTLKETNSYTIEGGEKEVLAAILPRLAGVFVYHALLESQASEHSARMVAMKSASDKAGEMKDSLTLRFNKARQATITREVSEITGGMEAMAN